MSLALATRYRTLLNSAGINTPIRLAHFFGQLRHESGLTPIDENLNYSAEGLLRTFPNYFTPASAELYARQPQRIANRVYANRMGNGDEASGDGWRYRGRGFIQITGKDNYRRLSEATGIDYVNNPDLLLNEADSMVAAVWFWQTNNLNALADRYDVKGITKRINGGTHGLVNRWALTNKYKQLFSS